MKLRHFLCFLGTLVLLLSCSQSGIIRTRVPSRPAGQQDMIQFAAEPIPDVGIGVVGLGMRGGDAVERLSFVPG
ncbi:MAG: glycosyl hydrolase, partial [Bacteroidales bacterium]|nr:glycosyl hydrolase [Bacteroidales bacterium]